MSISSKTGFSSVGGSARYCFSDIDLKMRIEEAVKSCTAMKLLDLVREEFSLNQYAEAGHHIALLVHIRVESCGGIGLCPQRREV